MKAKEKAEKLVDKFFKLDRSYAALVANDKANAKQYALIAVDLILDNDCGYWAYEGVVGNDIMIDKEFWQQVKEEINKLENINYE